MPSKVKVGSFLLIICARNAVAHNYSVLSDAIPQLIDLTRFPLSIPRRLGGRNGTHGCLLAVNQSFIIQDGNLALSNDTFLDPSFSLSAFEWTLSNGQPPCGAVYDGNRTGAPRFVVDYDWCDSNCGGWQLSAFKILRQWIGPMVGFILPSLVFCLSIPRRRKLLIGERWFIAKPNRTFAFFSTPLRAVWAAILVTIDTLLWLCICFAAAGPMILSGVYEAFLDSRILAVLQRSITCNSFTADMRAKLLLMILVGNFDMKDAGRLSKDLFQLTFDSYMDNEYEDLICMII